MRAVIIAVVVVLASIPLAARADIAIEGGGAFGNGAAGGQAALSAGILHVPLTPLSAELTVGVPFRGGFAATLDARVTLAGTALGAGAGFGTIGATNRTGAIYDALIGEGIAPHTALEARVYFGAQRATTVFAGVRFSL
jgi:hypothetical protein